MKLLTISAILCLALGGAACTTSSADDDLTFDPADGKADGIARPYGMFERTLGSGDDGFTLLNLNEDKTYDASQQLVRCDPGKCTDAFSGTYRFASSQGNHYIVLYKDGDKWYSFQYELSGDTLKLRYTDSAAWFTMTRATGA